MHVVVIVLATLSSVLIDDNFDIAKQRIGLPKNEADMLILDCIRFDFVVEDAPHHMPANQS